VAPRVGGLGQVTVGVVGVEGGVGRCQVQPPGEAGAPVLFVVAVFSQGPRFVGFADEVAVGVIGPEVIVVQGVGAADLEIAFVVTVGGGPPFGIGGAGQVAFRIVAVLADQVEAAIPFLGGFDQPVEGVVLVFGEAPQLVGVAQFVADFVIGGAEAVAGPVGGAGALVEGVVGVAGERPFPVALLGEVAVFVVVVTLLGRGDAGAATGGLDDPVAVVVGVGQLQAVAGV
jgi:hypothetical protein